MLKFLKYMNRIKRFEYIDLNCIDLRGEDWNILSIFWLKFEMSRGSGCLGKKNL